MVASVGNGATAIKSTKILHMYSDRIELELVPDLVEKPLVHIGKVYPKLKPKWQTHTFSYYNKKNQVSQSLAY